MPKKLPLWLCLAIKAWVVFRSVNGPCLVNLLKLGFLKIAYSCGAKLTGKKSNLIRSLLSLLTMLKTSDSEFQYFYRLIQVLITG